MSADCPTAAQLLAAVESAEVMAYASIEEQTLAAGVRSLWARLAQSEEDLGHARRFLAAEQEQCNRLGADNVRRMQQLGVTYPNGLDSGIDRLVAERDAAQAALGEMRAARDEAIELLLGKVDPALMPVHHQRIAALRAVGSVPTKKEI